MDAIELLIGRHSQPRLQEPAPSGEVLDTIMRAALRAPDHAALTPWRFIVCQDEGLNKLGKLMQDAAIADGMEEKAIERAPQLPLRAPMVIVACMKYSEHPKVPRVEQIASASSAVYAMQLAAKAQGFDSMWRTGSYAQSEALKQRLGLAEEDEIVGFIYMGTSPLRPSEKPALNKTDYFELWNDS